jgi:hypothetical protein
MIEEKQCNKCEQTKPIEKYRKYCENSFSKTCKKCLNELDKIRKKKQREKKSNTFLVKCEICEEEKVLKEFAKLKKHYKRKICFQCYPTYLREQKTMWCEKEHTTNINYRIKKSLAARLRNVLVKNYTTMNYIGCNILYLREWFEYNFTSEMNWENYGSYWSIDHIIPVRYFDLTLEDEKFKCCNWTNLMPVTINYNSSKRIIDKAQINNILNKIEKFKEEGSTTKWFSEEFVLNKQLVEIKLNTNFS